MGLVGMNTLVVTGGTSGIGASLVTEASGRGYRVIFGGSRDPDRVAPHLMKAGQYIQVDLEDSVSLNRFIFETQTTLGPSERNLFFVASAGISARKNEEEIERMRQINVEATAYLWASLYGELAAKATNCFVGVGSIVAAEEAAVKGDEAYQETKRQIQQMVTDAAQTDFRAFALIPGAIDTPMTRKEILFATLLLEVAKRVPSDEGLRTGLATYVGSAELGSTPAEILQTVLGRALTSQDQYEKVRKSFEKDPQLERAGAVTFLSRAARINKETANPEIAAAATGALKALDVVVEPDVVARALLDQLESGELPPDRLLKVYSSRGSWEAAPILGLMGSLG